MKNNQPSGLIGEALDLAVAKCEGTIPSKSLKDFLLTNEMPYDFDLLYDIKTWNDIEAVITGKPTQCNCSDRQLRSLADDLGFFIDKYVPKPYSTNWAFGGIIIEREMREHGFDLWSGHGQNEGLCAATYARGVPSEYVLGPTPLIAAMRCFVKRKIGNNVDAYAETANKIFE